MKEPLKVAQFLLKHPPLEELNESIVTIIQEYRHGTITETDATTFLLDNCATELNQYIERQKDLDRSLSKR